METILTEVCEDGEIRDWQIICEDSLPVPNFLNFLDASGKRIPTYENGSLADELYVDDCDPNTPDPFLGITIDREQDSHSRLEQVRLLDDQQTAFYQVDYTYDGASRMSTVASGGNTVTYTHTPATSVRQILTFNNGASDILTVSRSFDNLDRQISQSSAISGGTTHSYSYMYNDLNQRTRMTKASGEYWSYGYDSLGQVNSAIQKTAAGTPIPGYSYGYTFDDIGNREDATINGRTADYTTNLLNQYTSRDIPRAIDVLGTADAAATVTVDGQTTTREGDHFYKELDFSGGTSPNDARWIDYMVTGTLPDGGYHNGPRIADSEAEDFLKANPESYTYDSDGNLTSDGHWTYTWNAENRLVAMETVTAAVTAGAPNQKLEFAYDSQGRRFEKAVYEWISGAWSLVSSWNYLYDGWNLIAAIDGSGLLEQSYAWGLDLSGSLQGAGGVGGLLFVTDDTVSGPYAPWYDGNGNVMGYVDLADGEVVAEYAYGPFGEEIRSTGELADDIPFTFSTKFRDKKTDLLYYGFRYYSAEMGRWPSRDPLGEEGGRNLYGFVGNDGINHFDYLGLELRRHSGSSSISAMRVDPSQLGTIKGYAVGGHADPSWPLVIATTSGKNVSISGDLFVSIRIRSDRSPYDIGPDSRTYIDHERRHADIFIDYWNNNLKPYADAFEGEYCKSTCAKLASKMVNVYDNYLFQKSLEDNYDFDLQAYGHISLEIKYYLKGLISQSSAKANKALAEHQLFRDEWIKEGCTLPK